MLKVGSLFSGIGGICLGFQQAGCEIVFANEFDKNACKTYRLNHPNVNLIEKDIKLIDASTLPDIDILVGGFPCQSYSLSGKKLGLKDDRGQLFFDVVRILKEKKPKAFMLENVKNLLAVNAGEDFKTIKSELEALGYTVIYDVLSGDTHGNTPQGRERIFILGFLDQNCAKSFIFPSKVPLTTTLADIIKRDVKVADKYYYKSGTQYYDMINNAIVNDNIYQMRRVYMRENKSGVCPTLTANMGCGGHNVPVIRDNFGIRKLTPRECLLLQGFPIDFKVDLADVHIYKQAGNAVVVPLIKRIAESMIIALTSSITSVQFEEIKFIE